MSLINNHLLIGLTNFLHKQDLELKIEFFTVKLKILKKLNTLNFNLGLLNGKITKNLNKLNKEF